MFYQDDMSEIKEKLLLIDRQINLNLAANNFVINHLLRVISNKHPDDNIIQELKESIEADLRKINSVDSYDIKSAINALLKSPIWNTWAPKEKPLIE